MSTNRIKQRFLSSQSNLWLKKKNISNHTRSAFIHHFYFEYDILQNTIIVIIFRKKTPSKQESSSVYNIMMTGYQFANKREGQ